MPMKFPTIAQASTTLTLLTSLAIGGCSQTMSPVPAETPSTSAKSSATPTASSPDNASSTPPTIVEVAPKPVQTKPLTANAEDRTKESSNSQTSNSQKPIANPALLFSCMTNEGQEIVLFETDDTIDYSFGAPGKTPELDLQVPRDRASTWQWKGVGRAMSYTVNVPNGDTIYSVFWSVDRLSETRAVEAGVRVERDRKTLATVYCADKIVSNLQGVKLKPTEY